MRLSRKAGLLACGIRWIKYECTMKKVPDGTYDFGQSQWELTSSGQDANYYVQGYSDYNIEWNATRKRYEYIPAGTQAHATPAEPGTVYYIEPTTIEQTTVTRSGSYAVYSRDLLTVPHYNVEYIAGDKIGYVKAASGDYPDAKNGYTYVTEYDGYTIMKDGNGKYFAYKKA